LLGGEDLEGRNGSFSSFACVLSATTKKGRQLFLSKKVHYRENPGYAYVIKSRYKVHFNT